MLKDLVIRNRCYRRFDESKKVDLELLKQLVELCRFCPSAKNLQPLKFVLINTPELCNLVFTNLAWAGYLEDWDGPAKGERPTAYILILEDKRLSTESEWDQGIVAQTIRLGAAENGLGSCIIAAVQRETLHNSLNLPDFLNIALVIAIGVPVEQVVIDDTDDSGSIIYWRDTNRVHHVPKRKLDDLIWNV
ncbi:MAG TPA: nitroreductase [Bacteroidales bacterium]|nr:nitroreductase [Bacteroidales bacterium]